MAATSETFEHILHKFTNPVTRSVIKLVPPAEIMDQAEYDDLIGKFTTFCQAAWEDRKDPDTIDPRRFRAWGEEEG